ncbi:MAG: NrsF family protein [Erythrobacter sp.]
MNKPTSRALLIATLAANSTPVRRTRTWEGIVLIAAAAAAAAIAASGIFRFWSGILAGEASPYFWIANGLLLMLGAASTTALVAGALPQVGPRPSAPLWAFAMLGVLPLAAVIQLPVPQAHLHEGITDPAGLHCLSSALAAGLVVAVAAVLFLRRGAPVALARQAWLTGLASGALGTLAFGLTCPLDGIVHLGLWHVLPVPIAALLARVAVPPLIRW